MKTKTDCTRSFKICDSSGVEYEIHEYTTYNYSNAGGTEKWYEAKKEYKTLNGGNVGHLKHKQFQLPNSSEWLSEC